MALVCNIDQSGRSLRYRIGVMLLVLGALGFVAARLAASAAWSWLVAGLLAATGLFALFEARRGWCAARALGFKTKF